MSESRVESVASVEVQAAAEKMGWMPPSRFRGDPDRFIDADAYIKRGEEILPIVKEHNKRLQAELEALRGESSKTAQALAAAQEAIEQIELRHSVATQKAVEHARAEVKEQLALASEAGDHRGVAELTDQLTQLNKAEEKAEEKPTKAAASAPFVPPADLKAWNEENPWFGKDRRKTSLALGIAQELREGGERSTGRDFFDLVKTEMEKTLGGEPRATPSDKVEGARNGGSEGERGSSRKGYASLPADAKAACDADARQFVGPGKRYKTADEWRKNYAEIYFGG